MAIGSHTACAEAVLAYRGERPGHGWEFLPVLTSLQSYRGSYRFRQLIEIDGLLPWNFKPAS